MAAKPAELKLSSPLTLKCGLTAQNRLVKAALAEKMGSKFMPTAALYDLYRRFADGGWGMVLTGNVQVDARHLGQPDDVSLDESVSKAERLEAFKKWADVFKGKDTALIMQISHPGRQSARGAGKRGVLDPPMAPSPIPLRLGSGWLGWLAGAVAFGTPREMTHEDIAEVTRLFQETARLAHEAGFKGVELHAAHGYLLSQFLSSKGNIRTDEYGGTPAKRAKFVVDIIRAVREVVPASFCVGIKLNSADHQSEKDMAASMEQLDLIVAAGVDFIEISGGDYEDPRMMRADGDQVEKSERTKAREAFFLDFAREVRSKFPSVPLMVTGGFKSRQGMEDAVVGGDCDLIGLGRPAALNPGLPRNTVFNPELKDQDAVLYRRRIQPHWFAKFLGIGASIGAGAETSWYANQMKKLVLAA